MRRKQRKSLPWRRFGYAILIIMIISLRIINAVRNFIKYSKECFTRYPNTSKLIEKTRLRLVLLTHFSVFKYLMKDSCVDVIVAIKGMYLTCWRVLLLLRKLSVRLAQMYMFRLTYVDRKLADRFPTVLLLISRD